MPRTSGAGSGVPIEQIARLVGHSGGSKVTESNYRKQLRPVIDEGNGHGPRRRRPWA
jgi:hypothetical protein